MKLKRTTWILLATALALGGFVYFNEFQGAARRVAQREQEQKVFGLSEEQIERFTVERAGETLRFERTGKQEQPWQMKQPEDVPASEPAVAFLLNLLAKGRRDRTFAIAPKQLAEYGLDKPFATVTFFVKGQTQPRKLLLGKLSFDEQFVYAAIDPPAAPAAELSLTLIPIDFKYAVERKLPEWKKSE